jgi:hypothetical protein
LRKPDYLLTRDAIGKGPIFSVNIPQSEYFLDSTDACMRHDVGLAHTAAVRVFISINQPIFGRMVVGGRQR